MVVESFVLGFLARCGRDPTWSRDREVLSPGVRTTYSAIHGVNILRHQHTSSKESGNRSVEHLTTNGAHYDGMTNHHQMPHAGCAKGYMRNVKPEVHRWLGRPWPLNLRRTAKWCCSVYSTTTRFRNKRWAGWVIRSILRQAPRTFFFVGRGAVGHGGSTPALWGRGRAGRGGGGVVHNNVC